MVKSPLEKYGDGRIVVVNASEGRGIGASTQTYWGRVSEFDADWVKLNPFFTYGDAIIRSYSVSIFQHLFRDVGSEKVLELLAEVIEPNGPGTTEREIVLPRDKIDTLRPYGEGQ